MSHLEVRQLRYFVAVAEELHFGRAARRLGMAQPPLSRAIRDLERQLDAQLLERTTRTVALTPAGAVLLREARTALTAVAAAERRARRAGRALPVLRVALKADYDAGLLPDVLSAYAREEASLPVDLLLGSRDEQVPALLDGRADVAIIPSPFDSRGLEVEAMLTEPRVLAVAATDPLADHPGLRLADLAGRLLPNGARAELGVPPSATVTVADDTSADDTSGAGAPTGGADGDEGLTAQPTWTAPPGLDLAQIFNLVAVGSMVLFPPTSVARRYARPGVVFRTVADLPQCTLSLAWPESSSSPAVAAFVRAAASVAAGAAPELHLVAGEAAG